MHVCGMAFDCVFCLVIAMMYDISYSKLAELYFKKLKDKGFRTAFKSAIDILADNPSPPAKHPI